MVERVWVSETITLYGRTHMSLLVSAMEIMQIIVMDSHSPPSTSGHQAPKRSEFAEAHDGTLLSLDIHTSNELAEIHRHYGCWQACLAKIVSDYASKAGYVDTSLLEELLQALLISAKSTILNPYDLSATLNHRNDQVTDMSPLGYIRIENEDESHEWVEVNRELVLLDGLLRLTCSCMLSGAPFSESLVSAALTTYSALAPVSLHKVLKLDRRDLQNAFDLTKWSYTPSSGVSGLQYITVRQALLTIRYIALSGTTNELDFCIARNCLHVVNVCLSREGHSGSGSGAWLALSDYNADLMPLIELIGGKDFSIRFLSSRHMRQLVDLIVQSSSSVHIKPYKSVLSPACFPGLINLATWSGPEKLDEVLQAIIRDICVGTSNICETRFMDSRTPAIEYLRIFTLTKLGFSALLSVGDYPGNSKCITTAITRFTQLAANRDPQVTVDPVELGVLAVPGLLDAINAVVDDCSRSTERNQTLVEFADDVLVLLKVACSNDASKQLVVDHSALQKLWSTLLEMRDNDAAQTLASQLREIGVQIGVSFKSKCC
ncbi:hypothetical protein BDV93DRAFT_82456 [Ceratobasidium sp. AG-I]|nr:hypothetical protein BDV93DRAFT_82456 [Ceratobasidium sp. AG-I]